MFGVCMGFWNTPAIWFAFLVFLRLNRGADLTAEGAWGR